MKKLVKHVQLLVGCLLLTGAAALAQGPAANKPQSEMKTYVIERNIPGAGQFTPEKLKDISKTSCSVLKEMGPSIQWVQSYVTGDKIFCVYKAENIELLKEHAKRGGFPITNIYEVSSVISPATAGTN
jgi:Protein of unknown function (DUF4242)